MRRRRLRVDRDPFLWLIALLGYGTAITVLVMAALWWVR